MLLPKLIPLFVALSGTRAVTFEDWRLLVFTPAQISNPSISGADADPDGDHLNNFAEFALGRDPLTAESTPIFTVAFLPHIVTNLPRFGGLFTIPLDREGSLLLPQVTENLGTRWRADEVELWTRAWFPDGRFQYFAADAVPSDLPNHRFMRLLITADRDLDGLPDDWETAHGLDSTNPYDAFADADGDGDSNLDEFLHGTDAFNATDNTRRDEVPRAPRNAAIRHLPDGTHDVDWEDTSHNEDFFAIYDTPKPRRHSIRGMTMTPTASHPITPSKTACQGRN